MTVEALLVVTLAVLGLASEPLHMLTESRLKRLSVKITYGIPQFNVIFLEYNLVLSTQLATFHFCLKYIMYPSCSVV